MRVQVQVQVHPGGLSSGLGFLARLTLMSTKPILGLQKKKRNTIQEVALIITVLTPFVFAHLSGLSILSWSSNLHFYLVSRNKDISCVAFFL